MTEHSWYWAGTSTGDAGPYTDDSFSDVWRKLFEVDRTTQGIVLAYLNMMAVSGVTSPVAVNTGAAVVDGKFYENDASLNVVIPTPSSATRIDRIVLRKDWTAQTIRVTRIAGSEGGGAPSITQSDGTTWDIPLAQASITTGGVITLTDQRSFVVSPLGPGAVRYLTLQPFSMRDSEACDIGDGKAYGIIPPELTGWKLFSVHGRARVAGTTGTMAVQIANVDGGVDMLSTKLTWDSTEPGTETAATAYVVNPSNAVVSAYQLIRADFDAVQTTPAQGCILTLGFRRA